MRGNCKEELLRSTGGPSVTQQLAGLHSATAESGTCARGSPAASRASLSPEGPGMAEAEPIRSGAAGPYSVDA